MVFLYRKVQCTKTYPFTAFFSCILQELLPFCRCQVQTTLQVARLETQTLHLLFTKRACHLPNSSQIGRQSTAALLQKRGSPFASCLQSMLCLPHSFIARNKPNYTASERRRQSNRTTTLLIYAEETLTAQLVNMATMKISNITSSKFSVKKNKIGEI